MSHQPHMNLETWPPETGDRRQQGPVKAAGGHEAGRAKQGRDTAAPVPSVVTKTASHTVTCPYPVIHNQEGKGQWIDPSQWGRPSEDSTPPSPQATDQQSLHFLASLPTPMAFLTNNNKGHHDFNQKTALLRNNNKK